RFWRRSEQDAPGTAAEVGNLEIRRGDGYVVVALVGEDPKLRRDVVVIAPVPVEMVRRNVEQRRRLRREQLRVLELEGGRLADDGGCRVELADQRRRRGADVPGDGDRNSRLAVNVANPFAGG